MVLFVSFSKFLFSPKFPRRVLFPLVDDINVYLSVLFFLFFFRNYYLHMLTLPTYLIMCIKWYFEVSNLFLMGLLVKQAALPHGRGDSNSYPAVRVCQGQPRAY